MTLDAVRMRMHTAGSKTEHGWFLGGGGCLCDFVRFAKAGRYRVTVTAGIGYQDKERPVREFVVYVGHERFGPFEVQTVEAKPHSFTVSVPAGVEAILVKDFRNTGPYSVVKTVVEPAE